MTQSRRLCPVCYLNSTSSLILIVGLVISYSINIKQVFAIKELSNLRNRYINRHLPSANPSRLSRHCFSKQLGPSSSSWAPTHSTRKQPSINRLSQILNKGLDYDSTQANLKHTTKGISKSLNSCSVVAIQI